MKKFHRINNLVGWIIFCITFVVYTLTVEETASFWDCGEFIAVSYKLMVSHPPGAPFFMLLGRLFSFFALGNTSQVAFWINMLSVTASALTILFLFWSIILFGMKIYPTEGKIFDSKRTIKLMLAGVIGALAYTFSDSFWFSAVEAEVYAMSSFITSIVIWAMLRWELIKDKSRSNRWLILIAYIIGLSIGVHLLNLLAIPVLALIYYFKENKETTPLGLVKSLAVSGGIILFIMYAIIPGLPSIAGSIEIFFVNILGLPFNSGMVFFIIFLLSTLIFGIAYSQNKKKVLLNNILLSLSFILIGYSSYTLIIIRSNFDTPIDENDPENIISFVSYLKREQYGERPIFYGNIFTAKRIGTERGAPVYRKAEDHYEIYDYKIKPIYDKKDKILFSRIYSQQSGHENLYRKWMNLEKDEKPTMLDNLKYMFKYQLGHMYFRYFMWNFSGRAGDYKEADWLAPWETDGNAPEMIRRDKGRSNFYMIPFIIGILGLIFQYSKHKIGFWIVAALFFLTGIGLVLYLNSPPVEPRERDYIYVGSYYAFAIWIGFGFFFIVEYMYKILKNWFVAVGISVCMGFSVPFIMALNGWDNHDRSNRFHSVDQARNMLSSCAPNAILFTGGDNDTFPLWYVQEVEGFRTDVRVVVLSYFSTDWYIKQMKRKVYQSEPLPIKMDMNVFIQGKNDYIPLVEEPSTRGKTVDANIYIKLVSRDDPRVLVPLQDGTKTARLISRNFSLNTDREKILSLGFIPAEKEHRIVNSMEWSLKRNSNFIFKNELALLDILVHNKWERPIYFNNTSSNNINMDLKPYLHLEGMTYRLMPIKAQKGREIGEVNTDVMLQNIKKFHFDGFSNPNTYNDEEYRKFAINERNNFFRLANQLHIEGRNSEALEVLDMIMEKIPDHTIMYSYFSSRYVELYHLLEKSERAENIANILIKRAKENLEYLKKGHTNPELLNFGIIVLNQMFYIYRKLEENVQKKIEKISLFQGEDSSLKVDIEADKIAYWEKQKKNYSDKATSVYDLFNQYNSLRNR